MRKLLTLLLLSIVCIPLLARNYTIKFYDASDAGHDVSLSGSGPWTATVSGSTMANYVKNGKIWFNVLIGEQGTTNTYYHANSSTDISSGTSYTYYKYGSGSGATDYITWNSAYSSYTFTITATATDSDGQNVNLTISWAEDVYTSSVYLLGTINSWADNTTQVSNVSGSEWKLDLTKAQVESALWQGDFYFRFIENLSDGTKYGVYPNTDQTALTVGAAYTSDVYATTDITTDSKKDYYWKFTPTGADNYTIYFDHNGGTRSVKVTDDRPVWYLHSNLDNVWSGATGYTLTYNASSGYYETTLTESQINSASNDEMRFRIYDGSNSWGPQVSSYAFDDEGSESYTSTTNSTNNYFSIPKDFISAKIEAKQVTGGVLVNVTLVYDVNYYWVSPQITNGEKWEYFKMVPSRNRNLSGGGDGAADGKISKKYYTFTIKNDDLVTWKTKSSIADGTEIQWYIVREDDGLFFRPESNDPTPTASGTSLSYNSTTDSDCGYINYINNTSG